MTTINENFGAGGANLTDKGHGEVTLAETLRDVADDLAALRAAFVGVTAKLDLDVGVTDDNYAELHDPAALTTIKG